jgi:signal transduction histidine kinase
VAVRTLLTETAKDIEALCQQRGLRLLVTLPEEVTVLADKPKLTRILQNLLSNAVRYTERGEIELRGEVTEAQLRLTVRDTGIGIPAADLPRVFEEYYRHEQARVLHELGSGLGLATVRRLCDVLGGTVTVTSTPGQGSTFVVTVPHRGRAS